MPHIDARSGEVVIRIVYDGAPEAGKTTNVQQLSNLISLQRRGAAKSPGTTGDRTEFFDWLDFSGGYLDGRRVRCQLVSVPGQSRLLHRRRYLLESADAIVFVADSRPELFEDAAANFSTTVRIVDKVARGIPVGVILQANKQDLPGALAPERVLSALATERPMLTVGSIASRGDGVMQTFILAVRLATDRVRALALDEAMPLASETPEGLHSAMIAFETDAPGNAATRQSEGKNESERDGIERIDRERVTAANGEAEPVAREAAERVDAERTEAERVEAERVEAEHEAREEAGRVEAERLAREEAAREAARVETERKARDEAARIEAARIEAARIEAARIEAARVETERKARDEAARIEAARIEAERVEAARIEAARVETERKARDEAARIEAERVEAERIEAARIEAARVETERKAREEAARVDTERKREAARIEAARVETERKAREDVARIEDERKTREEAARVEAERKARDEAARIEAARVETERKARDEAARVEAERVEAARVETERIEAARIEAARVETERIEAARKAREEAARVEAERRVREEAARVEAERLARAEAARIETARVETQRKARDEAAHIEAERTARDEAARIEAERKMREEAARVEAERLARAEAARIETARVETQRKARDEAARIEAERTARDEAARIEAARVETERKAREEAARIEPVPYEHATRRTVMRRRNCASAAIPPIPDATEIASGHVWPPVKGRAAIAFAADGPVTIPEHVQPWAPNEVLELLSESGWVLHTAERWSFEVEPEARRRLLTFARGLLARATAISDGRALAVAPDGDRWRLWLVTARAPTVLDSLLAAFTERSSAKVISLVGRTLAGLRALGSERSIRAGLDGLALHDHGLTILGIEDDEPTDVEVSDPVRALFDLLDDRARHDPVLDRWLDTEGLHLLSTARGDVQP